MSEPAWDAHLVLQGELITPGRERYRLHRDLAREVRAGFLARYANRNTRISNATAVDQWYQCANRCTMSGPGAASTAPALVRTYGGGPNVADATPAVRVARFWSLTARRGPDECWLWDGPVSTRGYGRLGKAYAHRVSYEVNVGPIPDGLTIDHLCGVKRCVNPAHLEAVTREENHRRWVEGSTTCRNGHPRTVADTYILPGRGTKSCRECRRQIQRRYVARKRGGSGGQP